MGGRRRALVALALIVGLAGCGSRVQPAEMARAVGRSTEAVDQPAEAALAPTPDAGTSPSPTSAVPPKRSEPPLGQGPSDPASPRHNNGNITLTLSALCVRPNDVLIVTIKGGANAGYAMSASFADGSPHGAYNAGEAGPDGVFTWRIPILADVPPGGAKIFVMGTGTNWEGKDGGTADARFQVAGPEGCTT